MEYSQKKMPTINKLPKSKRNTYNRVQRQKYYQMKEWKNLSHYYRMIHPICEECQKNVSEQTHHIISPFQPNLSETERMALLLDTNNLKALCASCHNAIHQMQQNKIKKNLKISR